MFKKLFSRGVDRKKEGKQRVGRPLWEFMSELQEVVNQQPWTHEQFQPPIAEYYFSTVPPRLPGVIDAALSDEQLVALSPETVWILLFELTRDYFRHTHHLLRVPPPNSTSPPPEDGWVKTVFDQLATKKGIALDRVPYPESPFDIERDRDAPDWAKTLSMPFGDNFNPLKLYALHSSIVTGALADAEDGGGGKQSPKAVVGGVIIDLLATITDIIEEPEYESVDKDVALRGLKSIGYLPDLIDDTQDGKELVPVDVWIAGFMLLRDWFRHLRGRLRPGDGSGEGGGDWVKQLFDELSTRQGITPPGVDKLPYSDTPFSITASDEDPGWAVMIAKALSDLVTPGAIVGKHRETVSQALSDSPTA